MASRKGAKDAKNLRELLLNLGDKWRIEGLRVEGIEARAHRRSQVGGNGEWDGAISRGIVVASHARFRKTATLIRIRS